MSNLLRTSLRIGVTILLWQGLCFLLLYFVATPLDQVYVWLFDNLIGNALAGNAINNLGALLLFLTAIPLPVTWLCVEFYRWWSGKTRVSREIIRTVAIWQGLLLVLCLGSFFADLTHYVLEIGRPILAEPRSLFDIVGLIYASLIVWVFCSLPAAIAALVYFERRSRALEIVRRG